jgi:hypothetical protein
MISSLTPIHRLAKSQFKRARIDRSRSLWWSSHTWGEVGVNLFYSCSYSSYTYPYSYSASTSCFRFSIDLDFIDLFSEVTLLFLFTFALFNLSRQLKTNRHIQNVTYLFLYSVRTNDFESP